MKSLFLSNKLKISEGEGVENEGEYRLECAPKKVRQMMFWLYIIYSYLFFDEVLWKAS